MTTSTQSYYEDIETRYDERFDPLFILFKVFAFISVVGLMLPFVVFIASQSSWQVTALSAFASLVVVAGGAYDLWCQYWKWIHWGVKVDADRGAAELHRPGNGRSLFPYISDRGVQYMPLLGAQVTKDEKKWYEQWIFRRSSTVSLDGDAQSDVDWQNLRFIRDSKRIKNIIIAYNQRERSLEHAQNDYLANIAKSNARIVEQNERIIEQNDELLSLLRPVLLVLNGQGVRTTEIPVVQDDDGEEPSE